MIDRTAAITNRRRRGIVPASELGKRGAPALLPAGQFVDFRPGIDVVVIDGSRGGRTFIRDTQGLLADQEVLGDLLTSTQRVTLESTPLALIGMKAQAVRACPHLSKEGQHERLAALQVAWRLHAGDSLFAVSA